MFRFCLFLCVLTGALAHNPVFYEDGEIFIGNAKVSHAVYGCVSRGQNHTVTARFKKKGTEKRIQLLASATESPKRRRSLVLYVDDRRYDGCEGAHDGDGHSHATKVVGTDFWEPFTQSGYEYRQCLPEGVLSTQKYQTAKIVVTSAAEDCVRYSLSVGVDETWGLEQTFLMDIIIARVHQWAGEYYVPSTVATFTVFAAITVGAHAYFCQTFRGAFVALSLSALITSYLNRFVFQMVFNVLHLRSPEGETFANVYNFCLSVPAHLLLVAAHVVLLKGYEDRAPPAFSTAGRRILAYFILAFVTLNIGILGVQTFYVSPAALVLAMLVDLI